MPFGLKNASISSPSSYGHHMCLAEIEVRTGESKQHNNFFWDIWWVNWQRKPNALTTAEGGANVWIIWLQVFPQKGRLYWTHFINAMPCNWIAGQWTRYVLKWTTKRIWTTLVINKCMVFSKDVSHFARILAPRSRRLWKDLPNVFGPLNVKEQEIVKIRLYKPT